MVTGEEKLRLCYDAVSISVDWDRIRLGSNRRKLQRRPFSSVNNSMAKVGIPEYSYLPIQTTKI